MDDAGLLRVLELLLQDRFASTKAAARSEGEMLHAAEFGRALVYIRERIEAADRLGSALAPFTG